MLAAQAKPGPSRAKPGAIIGRPTKYSDEVRDVLVDAFRSGLSTRAACGLAGITAPTLSNWLADPELVELRLGIEQARAKHEQKLLQVMQAAAEDGDTKAATWILERCHPESYGRGRRVDAHVTSEQERQEIQDPPALTMETMAATWIRALHVAEGEYSAGRLEPRDYLRSVLTLSGLSGRALEIASRQADMAEVPPLQIDVSLGSPSLVESPTRGDEPGPCGDVIEVT